MSDRKRRTEKWEASFIEAFRQHGNHVLACEQCGVSQSTPYKARERSKAFEEKYHEAEKEAAGRLEWAAYQRAVNGVARPLFQGGKQMFTNNADGSVTPVMIHEFSDYLLVQLLQARMPEKYGRNANLAGSDGPAYKIYIGIDESRV